MNEKRPQIAVIGAGCADRDVYEMAEEVGRNIARRGGILLCGGLGGVMEAASRGAKSEGGMTIGILPGDNAKDANPYIDIGIVTNIGHARNIIIAHSADALIAVDGGFGTLSEMAIALKVGKPVISLKSWQPASQVINASSAEEAVNKAFEAIK